jgi:hypothetical protein
MNGQGSPAAEFSRQIVADQVGVQETLREIAANAAERAKLADRFGLLSLERLSATVHLRRGRDGLIRVRGRLVADATQACVVTLEPVAAHLEQDFAVCFAAEGEAEGGPGSGAGGGEVVLALDEADPPEAILDGRIDIGEAVAQQLALALDSYPRSPAAALSAPEGDAETARAPAFAALSAWRTDAGKK